jgi:hypothetical protein
MKHIYKSGLQAREFQGVLKSHTLQPGLQAREFQGGRCSQNGGSNPPLSQ